MKIGTGRRRGSINEVKRDRVLENFPDFEALYATIDFSFYRAMHPRY